MIEFKVTKKRNKILKQYGFEYDKEKRVYHRQMLFDDAEVMKNNGNSYNYYYWSNVPETETVTYEEIPWSELRELLIREYPNE